MAFPAAQVPGAAAFVDAFLAADLSDALATIFVAALGAFSASPVIFLREVLMATTILRTGPH
jgi:hypothetical protein